MRSDGRVFAGFDSKAAAVKLLGNCSDLYVQSRFSVASVISLMHYDYDYFKVFGIEKVLPKTQKKLRKNVKKYGKRVFFIKSIWSIGRNFQNND